MLKYVIALEERSFKRRCSRIERTFKQTNIILLTSILRLIRTSIPTYQL